MCSGVVGKMSRAESYSSKIVTETVMSIAGRGVGISRASSHPQQKVPMRNESKPILICIQINAFFQSLPSEQ